MGSWKEGKAADGDERRGLHTPWDMEQQNQGQQRKFPDGSFSCHLSPKPHISDELVALIRCCWKGKKVAWTCSSHLRTASTTANQTSVTERATVNPTARS